MYSAVFSDETVGFALSPWSVVFPDDSDGRRTHRASLQLAADSARESGTPTVISSLTLVPWTDWILALRRDNPHVAVVRGIDMTIRALSRLFPAPARPPGHPPPRGPASGGGRPWPGRPWPGRPWPLGDRRAADPGPPRPAGRGRSVPRPARTRPAGLMRELPGPVVVKLDLRGVPHKDQAGAVTVGCRTPADVRRAVRSPTGGWPSTASAPARYSASWSRSSSPVPRSWSGSATPALGRFLTVGTGGTRAGRGSAARTVLLPAIPRRRWSSGRAVPPPGPRC